MAAGPWRRLLAACCRLLFLHLLLNPSTKLIGRSSCWPLKLSASTPSHTTRTFQFLIQPLTWNLMSRMFQLPFCTRSTPLPYVMLSGGSSQPGMMTAGAELGQALHRALHDNRRVFGRVKGCVVEQVSGDFAVMEVGSVYGGSRLEGRRCRAAAFCGRYAHHLHQSGGC